MGVALSVIYDPEVSEPGDFTTNPDGRLVAAAVPRLDEIAAAKGLLPFSRFITDDAIEAFLANDPEFADDDSDLDDSDLDELPGRDRPTAGPLELWFDPAEGRAMLDALIGALRTEPVFAAGQPAGWADDVAGCLERLRADLDSASRSRLRFSLCYS